MNNYLTGYESLQDNFHLTKNLIKHLDNSSISKLYRQQLDLLETEALQLILEGNFNPNAEHIDIPPRLFSREEIDTLYNGKDGKPFYIVSEGYVFDASHLPLWQSKTFASLERNANSENYFASYHQYNLMEMQKTAPIVGRFAG